VKGLKIRDVGCNDGSLLDAFARRGALTYGIEPTDAAHEAASKGHSVELVYFDLSEANRYVATHGFPDIVTFVNVFAHIDGLPRLITALGALCGPHTIVVIENHYLGSVLERKQFDTFYHEHPRTYSYTSFTHIAAQLGMHVKEVEFPTRYGGNIRVYMYPGLAYSDARVLAAERGFKAGMLDLASQVQIWRTRKQTQLFNVITIGREYPVYARIPAIAFPGRAAILFQLLGVDERHIEGVYEVPRSKKIGHYCPGTRIEIKSDDTFPTDYPGPIVNMAWHISAEIEERWRGKGYSGEIIPIIAPSDFTNL
jgi:SAM-dependent methyltransferase